MEVKDNKNNKTMIRMVVIVLSILIVLFIAIAVIINSNNNDYNSSTYSTTYNTTYTDTSTKPVSHYCDASGCTKEGKYSINGTSGREYYCYTHYKQMEAWAEMLMGY